MDEIIWEESFSVGIKDLDEQHKQIIKMINTLINNKDAKVDSETISDVLTDLTKYAEHHFEKEEQYMKNYNYPEYSIHREQHKTFKLQVVTFCIETMAEKETIPDEVLSYLKSWLINHILETDMKYKTFFQNHGLS